MEAKFKYPKKMLCDNKVSGDEKHTKIALPFSSYFLLNFTAYVS